jgi:hypothetical protein
MSAARTVDALSVEQVMALPAAVDFHVARRALGIGRDRAARMAANGALDVGGEQVRVLQLSPRRRICRKADICRALGIALTPTTP